MPHPVPYLAFDGNCTEAVRFYEQVLGGKLEVLMTNGQSPVAEHCPAKDHDRVMHARLVLPDGGMLMAGDSPTSMPYEGIKGVMLTISYDTVEEAEHRFRALAEGGQITMPWQPTFWAKQWGMCVDRFGVSWAVNGELLPL